MRKLFKRSEEESSSWQSYTDLMAGFLAVFIIASLISVSYINKFAKIINRFGGPEGITVPVEIYDQLVDITEAIEKIDSSEYFRYNKKYKRIEYRKDIRFNPDEAIIPLNNHSDLVNAGREISNLVSKLILKENIGFKIIIEGRTANSHTSPIDRLNEHSKLLSYKRALSLYNLWQQNGIIDSLNQMINVELFVSGAGMEGKGRYSGLGPNGEDRNKLFIIQIVPYLIVK